MSDSDRTFFDQCIQTQIDVERARYAHYGREPRHILPGRHTIGQFVLAVLAIEQADDAARFYRGYLGYLAEAPDLTDPPEQVAQYNIGWCFGEGMTTAQIAMWREACDARHPVFGVTVPTMEEALAAGVALGKATRKQPESE